MSKTILINGGSRGIGRAAYVLAARRAWSVGPYYLKGRAAAQSTVAEAEQLVGTEIHATCREPDWPYKVGASTPLGRPGIRNEIAEAIVRLPSHVTGAINVTGGR
jgi:hypothetical protein